MNWPAVLSLFVRRLLLKSAHVYAAVSMLLLSLPHADTARTGSRKRHRANRDRSKRASLAGSVGQNRQRALQPGGRLGHVRCGVAVREQAEVHAAVVAEDAHRQRLV